MNEDKSAAADDGGVGAINDIVGFHIRLAHGAVYRHFMESFAHLDLTQKQVSVLWLVSDHPGIAQADLAQRLQMDRATVMAIVNRLQARDYLERGMSQVDRRRQTLMLRPAGHEALRAARTAIVDHEHWLTSRFTKREVAQLVGLLTRIHG
ncbi:MarR family winged helix-turn-helix transcriptional regulator [Sphingomonas sp. M1-B02]|uniref:MarR family winged helix-turn-helix transcriptional regulator n=1 Tax=Sphingomonas sp. M1-B02 TaxID=3114300 RepID=UPI0022407BC8|nr:MarR family winged helix-turn-helix transcriptional regulator [Sphingomonas sp. S6-11]UZK65202.1 MarR family winged helix-turn-helix transcriptional regulator [Sphingomonas sp. S6-11]